MTSLTDVQLAIRFQANLTDTLDLGSKSAPQVLSRAITLDSGTGANQADRVFTDIRTIAISGTDDLDLAGSLLDAYGNTITFVKVKGIFVAADSLNTNNVILGAAAANQFIGPFGAATHTAAIHPGGFQCFACSDAAGWPVVAGTGDLLRVANSGAGTTVNYAIAIIGTSA